ncbi:site-2 protease family protein, partial [Candidatus Microgenomates bacterium]|nr:site-2 protease family protein [Candidatus Microgenomates bacterium]
PIIFGAAKPVPVDPFNLKEGRKDMSIVALAGPLTNLLLAITAAIIFKILDAVPIVFPSVIGLILALTAKYNLLLAVFNLIPIPPLDGSKVFAIILPDREAAAYLSLGSMGMFIIFFLLFFPIGPFNLGEVVFRLVQLGLVALGF